MKYFVWLGWLATCLTTGLVSADNIHISGFATVATSHSDSDEVSFESNFLNNPHSDFSFRNESKLGLQVNAILSSQWDLVTQVVVQDRINKSINDFLELAFVSYRPNRYWSLRAGRINSDLYLLSEYRYTGYAYLWSHPPNEFYALSSALSNFDGVDLEYKNNLLEGFLRFRLAYGSTESQLGKGQDLFKFRGKNQATISASYQINNWLIRAAHSQSKYGDLDAPTVTDGLEILEQIPSELWSSKDQIAEDFDISGKSSYYRSLGVSYESSKWLFHSELGLSKIDWLLFSSTVSGYATLGYIQDEMTYFLSLSALRNRNKRPTYDPPELTSDVPTELSVFITSAYEGFNSRLDSVSARQATVSAGIKYDYSSRFNLKFQVEHTNISPQGYGLWVASNTDILSTRHKVNTLSLSLNAMF